MVPFFKGMDGDLRRTHSTKSRLHLIDEETGRSRSSLWFRRHNKTKALELWNPTADAVVPYNRVPQLSPYIPAPRPLSPLSPPRPQTPLGKQASSAHRKLGRAFAIVRITTSFASAIVHPFQEGTQPTNKDLQPQTNFLKLMLLQSHPNAGFDYAICGTLLAIPGSKLLLRLTAATVQPISGATNSSNAIANDIHGREVSWSASPEESLWSRGADNTVVQPCAASEVQYHNASSDATADDYI
ncbi:uncharacterized protein J4E87_006459 [Alternaria ethzedia]|uniref:uncharacterized protein n=1 Tax=Alternaria ethzedia TaxID=181014 RepID=UPI0020C53618|nr:uncharacterized protein J4E87_006459 [Alternaria ethzedia]KAI4622517.1 hypothetical protein J4E87_006459 [Alternaria ethzedia]